MDFLNIVGNYISQIWNGFSTIPILNTGLQFKDIIFGMIGFNVLFFILKTIFNIDGGTHYKTGKSKNEKIAENRKNDQK